MFDFNGHSGLKCTTMVQVKYVFDFDGHSGLKCTTVQVVCV